MCALSWETKQTFSCWSPAETATQSAVMLKQQSIEGPLAPETHRYHASCRSKTILRGHKCGLRCLQTQRPAAGTATTHLLAAYERSAHCRDALHVSDAAPAWRCIAYMQSMCAMSAALVCCQHVFDAALLHQLFLNVKQWFTSACCTNKELRRVPVMGQQTQAPR
jgi:hypothetical protein